ncbi:hypothetical protein FDECE_4475 [Fusarium decemcellulare]|nr:hypothetical protein FDECE_4475 [Fusarium decemcellulare]
MASRRISPSVCPAIVSKTWLSGPSPKLTREPANALRDYREFRAEGGYLFPSNRKVEQIIQDNTLLEQKKAELAALQEGSEQANKLKKEIDELVDHINNQFQQAVASITSGISIEKKTKAKKALWSRLIMALGGGLALVVPMLIMVLHPGKMASMLTTSSFVVAAAICLAVFMEDSQSKDVIACTAAYAAVLVVFVGAGGGT